MIEEQPMAYKKPVMSVGEEFIAWAEQYWRIDELLDLSTKDPSIKGAQENCPYSAMRPIFIEKINKIIQKRIEDYL